MDWRLPVSVGTLAARYRRSVGKALGGAWGMGQLEIQVLGAPRVQHGEAVLAFPTRKALALFLFLVVEGDPQPRDKLAALFWPDRDEPHARAMLRYTLVGIRRTLQDSAEAPHIVFDQQVLRV